MAEQFDEAASAQRRADVVARYFTGAPASNRPTIPVPGFPPGGAPDVPLTGNAPHLPPHSPADEMPIAGRPAGTPPGAPATNLSFAYEPTDRLPFVTSPTPAQPAVAPRAAGRVALIYEQQIRRPWRLWVFTAVLVSLTLGVVLGQAEAYRPPSPRSASAAQGGAIAPPPPSAVIPTPPVPLTAPLGAVKQRQLEITGTANTLRIRTADLGDTLYTINSYDQSAAFQLTDIGPGSLLTLAPGATGTVGAEVLLNAKVAWTLRLTGGTTDLDVDSRAGGLAAVQLAAGVSRGVLQLPQPQGIVPLTVTSPVSELTVRTATGAPVRVRLAKGAGLATINGKARRGVKVGATLREPGWPTAKTKYDLRITADVSTLLIERPSPGA